MTNSANTSYFNYSPTSDLVRVIYGKTVIIATVNLFGSQYIGEAKLDPQDDFDEYIGFHLAVSRALEAAHRDYSKKAWAKIKHKDDVREHKRQLKAKSKKKKKGKK